MAETVIRAEGLGKRYRLGSHLELRDTLRDQIAATAGAAARRLSAAVSPRRGRAGDAEGVDPYLWALRDVSLEVPRGEVLGVIGRNGAGKTTLLKVLSRITEPTEGRAEIHGRVGSLLEVGTGFHSELTGRENIFLSGAIMGMRRAEIRRKFDEIVSFAGVERFTDTPVKRYSSGMYVRLAFAVAAFLEAEILLIDEVLAVGDNEFQRKCLGKMDEVARGEGRTILLVSHNMGSINRLCHRAVWLDAGRIREEGETSRVVRSYLAATDPGTRGEAVVFPEIGAKDSQLRTARLVDREGNSTGRFSCDEPVIVELVYEVRRRLAGLYGCFQVSAYDGTPVLVSYSYDHVPNPMDDLPPGDHLLRIVIPARSLAPGDYRVSFSVGCGLRGTTIIDDPGAVASFTLDDNETLRGNSRLGYFSTLLDWTVSEAAPARSDVA